MLQWKDTELLSEKTNKATTKRKQPRPIGLLPTETQIRSKDTDWDWGDGKKYSVQMEIKRNLG